MIDKKAVLLNFSLRGGGNCAAVSDHVSACLHGAVTVSTFERPRIAPCGDCAYRCFHGAACPHAADDAALMYEAVCGSDIAVYIVPNYCDYPNACFFAFNERGQSFFQDREDRLEEYLRRKKLFIVISNTEEDNFTKAFSYHIPTGEKPAVLFLRARQYKKNSLDGDLMEALEAQEAVDRFIRGAIGLR